MKAFKIFMIIALLVVLGERSFSQEIWTIGPMLHVNFGGEKRTTSFTIEAAYWNISKFHYSVDVAIEFERSRVRLYSEAQTGIGLAGVSCGPVLEFNAGNGTHLGIQGSCWANYFLGFDYRMRFIDKHKFHCVGTYAKIPFATTGLGDGGHSWSDWDDWD